MARSAEMQRSVHAILIKGKKYERSGMTLLFKIRSLDTGRDAQVKRMQTRVKAFFFHKVRLKMLNNYVYV